MENQFEQVAMKVSVVTIIANLLLSVFKLFAGVFAHSGAMISDAVHSASDVFSTFVVMIGIKLLVKTQIKNIPMDMNEWNVWQLLSWPRFFVLLVLALAIQQ